MNTSLVIYIVRYKKQESQIENEDMAPEDLPALTSAVVSDWVLAGL